MLYDLKNDLGEKIDVAAAQPEIATKIEAYLTTARSESADWEPRWTAAPRKSKSTQEYIGSYEPIIALRDHFGRRSDGLGDGRCARRRTDNIAVET